jgi:hypothetical protein
VGGDRLHVVATGGGKIVFTNDPLTVAVAARAPEGPARLGLTAFSRLLLRE